MNEYNLWFSLVKLPNKIKLQLLGEFNNTKELWENHKKANVQLLKESKIINSFEEAWRNKLFTSEDNKKLINNLKIVTFYDEMYPKKLRNLEDAPTVLFYEGNINKLNENLSIAVVGSRKCTNYGINATKLITKELSVNNIIIVSGLAKGIDTYAHSTCVSNGGYTCGVLGCGIDVIYPKENKALYKAVASTGCIISEYPPGTMPYNFNFPERNRIISALSDVILVVEAGYKSGSLITASRALDQGKDVIVVPGSVFSEQSRGTNKLIKDGAYVFTAMEDIFDLIGIKNRSVGTNNSINISPKEERIFSILSSDPIHIDDIIRITNVDIKQLYEVLFELQLKNAIMCLAGNYYVKINSTI